MSNYRDDTQETAVAGSSTWLGLSSIVEDGARATGAVLFGLMVLHSDEAVAGDEVIGQANHTVVETATASDQTTGHKWSASLVHEQAGVTESYRYRIGSLTAETAMAGDTVIESLAAVTTEHASVTDEVLDQGRASVLIVESARIDDNSYRLVHERVDESVRIAEQLTGALNATNLIAEVAGVADQVIDTQTFTVKPVLETATASDQFTDRLMAREMVTEMAVIEAGPVIQGLDVGQAWTANIETWAMSRYEPYGFSHIAVIDGVIYGEREDGVYALSGGSEEIAGELKTGKLDLGQGQLAHPVEAYLEYELTGTVEMDVTTSQSGVEKSYTYRLPKELALDLTNGRIPFGKGLRGRHFSFTLRMTGEHGHINDLSVRSAPSKRRV